MDASHWTVTEDYEIIFVADPCPDRTVEIIREENTRDERVKLLLFSGSLRRRSAA